MIRIAFTMLFWVVVGRYLYAELTLLAPGASPYVDRLLSAVEIPTHDRWNPDTIRGLKAHGMAIIKTSGLISEGGIGLSEGHDRAGLDSVIVRAISAKRGQSGLEQF